MIDIGNILIGFMQEAWGALLAVIVAMSVLAMLSQVLKTAGGAMLGANLWVWEAVGAMVSILVIALFAFLGVPQIISSLLKSFPVERGCGPVGDLGQFSAMLIGGLVSIRLLISTARSLFAAAVGASSSMSGALMEGGEAMFGMLIASLIVPLTAALLGAC